MPCPRGEGNVGYFPYRATVPILTIFPAVYVYICDERGRSAGDLARLRKTRSRRSHGAQNVKSADPAPRALYGWANTSDDIHDARGGRPDCSPRPGGRSEDLRPAGPRAAAINAPRTLHTQIRTHDARRTVYMRSHTARLRHWRPRTVLTMSSNPDSARRRATARPTRGGVCRVPDATGRQCNSPVGPPWLPPSHSAISEPRMRRYVPFSSRGQDVGAGPARKTRRPYWHDRRPGTTSPPSKQLQSKEKRPFLPAGKTRRRGASCVREVS